MKTRIHRLSIDFKSRESMLEYFEAHIRPSMRIIDDEDDEGLPVVKDVGIRKVDGIDERGGQDGRSRIERYLVRSRKECDEHPGKVA